MKTRWMLMALVAFAIASTYACNDASFGSRGAKKGNGAVLPVGGVVNPAEEPLNLSEEEANKPIAENGGPHGGDGKVLDKTIELGCENASGVIVDVGEPGMNPPKLALLGKGGDVDLDKDGYPTGKDGGGKDDGKGGGKDDGPTGEEPLPEIPGDEVPESAKVQVRVKGKFCPKSQRQLTVMFVVDYSGSMGRHVPGQNLPEVPGNDPQVNGSCGRLRAAEAILKKLSADSQASDDIQIGMIPFAGGIVVNKVMKVMSLKDFAQSVSKDTFCQYVVQNPSFGYDPANPGGIDGGGLFGFGGVDASTNYRAAFTAAESVLRTVYGRKVVYFVSDGEPTSGGADPVQAGIDAGESLRKNVSNLTLNALLLGSPRPEAKLVLERVAGAPERVRHADSADELADKILGFPEGGIDEASGKAFLTVAPYPRADLGLRALGRDPSDAGVWLYETQPFVLLGKPGQDVVNVVEVTALGKDGSTHAATVKITYRQKP